MSKQLIRILMKARPDLLIDRRMRSTIVYNKIQKEKERG